MYYCLILFPNDKMIHVKKELQRFSPSPFSTIILIITKFKC